MKDNSREALQKKLLEIAERTIIHKTISQTFTSKKPKITKGEIHEQRPNHRHRNIHSLRSNSSKLRSCLIRPTATHLHNRISNASADFTILDSRHSCPHRFPSNNVHRSLDRLDNGHNTPTKDDRRARSRHLAKHRSRRKLNILANSARREC